MVTDSSWAETWHPGNRLGFVTSVTSALVLAVFFWWLGVVDPGVSITALSSVELVGVILLGLLIGGGAVLLHAKRVWRERWRTSMRLRAVVSLPLVVVIGVVLTVSPAVVSLAFLVLAAVFVPGRTALYLNAGRVRE